MTGWINYYGIIGMKTFMSELNGWLKRRIRQYIWKQWENPRTKRKNLIRLGIDKAKAYEWSNTRKGIWSISKKSYSSSIINRQELVLKGYEDISLKYQFYTQLIEPPYTGPYVRWCERAEGRWLSPLLDSFSSLVAVEFDFKELASIPNLTETVSFYPCDNK